MALACDSDQKLCTGHMSGLGTHLSQACLHQQQARPEDEQHQHRGGRGHCVCGMLSLRTVGTVCELVCMLYCGDCENLLNCL
jgi:hypothetical protein